MTAFPLISQRETVGRLLVGTRSPGERLGPDDERLLVILTITVPQHWRTLLSPAGGAVASSRVENSAITSIHYLLLNSSL